MPAEDSRWFDKHCARAGRPLRLFCIPHAGAAGYPYRAWMPHLPESIEVIGVRLPGRGARIAEVAFRRMDPLVTALTEAIIAELGRPFALFGHSMGALIAFELCARLGQLGFEPRHLFVSGTRAPHLPRDEKALHTLPRERFIQELRALNGTATELLEDESVVASLLPPLRADFELVETYPARERARLTCPITAFGGRDDPTVSEDELAAWSRYTTQDFRRVLFPGDHFFIASEQSAVLRTISQTLSASSSGRGSVAAGT